MEPIKVFKQYLLKKRQEKRLMDNFRQQWETYNQLAIKADSVPAEKKHLYPCIYDATSETVIDPTYFYQDTWAFEQILKNKPKQHYDIGSHHKFVAFLSKLVPVTMIDIRPLSLPLDSLLFKKGSITELPFDDCSIDSLSSLCVVEHIGLGRYGDPLDPKGSEKSLKELTRVLNKDGYLYLSVPVSDKDIIAFNAGRIFHNDKLLSKLSQNFDIVKKDYICGKELTNEFVPNDRFGTTILLTLKKI